MKTKKSGTDRADDEDNPWNWLQPYDVRRMGEIIQDPAEQKRWCNAVILGGGLPYMWRRMALPLMHLMYDKLNPQDGDRVLLIGEGIDACGFERDIRSRVGTSGTITSIDIMEKVRNLSSSGQTPQWRWDFADTFSDDSFDRVGILQAVAHAEDWQETARDLTRVLRPGGNILLAEITFPPTIKFAAELDIHLEFWLKKLFSGAGRNLDDLTYCSLETIEGAFRGLLTRSASFTWKGVDLFWGTRPLRQS